MGHLQIQVKMPFGEIIINGENAKEILDLLNEMPPEFIETISSLVSTKLTPPIQAQLEGIVELTTEGPVITTRGKYTHYEAIGLILYASEEKTSSTANIDQLLQSSGVKAMVPARLNEMTKRGLVFRPDPNVPQIKLTAQGEKWIEKEIVPKLKEKG